MSVHDAMMLANTHTTVSQKRGYGYVVYCQNKRLCERISSLRKAKEFVNTFKLWHALDTIGYGRDDAIYNDVKCGQNWKKVLFAFHKANKVKLLKRFEGFENVH